MLAGVLLRRCLPCLSPGWFWRALAMGLFLTAFILWGSKLLPLRAQPSTPHLLITEVHPSAKAVAELAGEWFEIHNPGSEAINLQFWSITNNANVEHVIALEVWVAPGSYIVLGNAANPAQNGGVSPAYLYPPFSLGNESEILSLRNPEGEIVDQVAWGEGTSLTVPSGVSLERSAPQADAPWVLAHSPWPGSAGDLGSPGAPYTPPPTATPTATPPPETPPRLLLSEIMANPRAASDDMGEWIELYNGDSEAIYLNGWRLADLDGEETILNADVWLQPGAYVVVARSSDPIQNGGVNAQIVYSGLQLANEADELILKAPWGAVTDQLVWDANNHKITEGASLERTSFDADATWVTAHTPWPGSAGDRGTPGTAYVPGPTATPTATLPPTPDTLPRLFLSEVMANPKAVGDDAGEWVEIYNGDSVSINLNGWVLADHDNDRTTISGDLWLEPGAYVVLARNIDPAQNGGVTPQYSYTGMQLANEADELLLITPWGVVVDQLLWGDTLRIVEGASLERTTFDSTATWTTAHTPWPGSAGDRGSPGAPYVAPTPTPLPAATATPEPSPTPLPIAWGIRGQPSPLIIAQVYPHGSEQEYIVLHNWTGAPLSLAGWRLGDAEAPGDREGLLLLPPDVTLDPGAYWVVARHAATFQATWGQPPHATWNSADGLSIQLVNDPSLASGEIELADNGDEVLLLDPEGALADAVAWDDGSYTSLALTGRINLPNQIALHQAPDAPFPSVRDVRHRFMLLPPNPFGRFSLPTLPAHAPVTLDGGMVALWGSLGAASTFSPGGSLPPHVLLAAAQALGLDFLAIADSDRAPLDMVTSAQSGRTLLLPAWRWHHPDGYHAVVYSERSAILLGWGEFLEFLNKENALAQLPPEVARDSEHTPLLAADTVSAPGSLTALQKVWQSVKSPLLPAGNTTPLLPGGSALSPHYTGLAATNAGSAALLEALAARRGWLTSSPGLWLTLRTETGVWMGGTVGPQNELTLHITYGDSSGESAGLALWQGDQLVRQLDLPPADGRWHVTIPAAPGSMIYAVATQLDGDFAISAPIYVAPAEGGRVIINEVLPAPGADHNGDGQTNTDDEYIELINVGSAPLSLADYSLGDASSATGGRRFTFGSDRFIGAGERLLLWHREIGLSLNDDADFVQLFDAEGTVLDHIAWEQRERGPSLSRVPDGGDWQNKTPPTPGQANRSYPPPDPPKPPKADDPPVDPADVGDPQSPNFGQATGPPGSIALAKVRGLYSVVEFRAQVVVPPGLFPSAIYVAEAALDANGAPMPVAGLGIQVYLNAGDFIPMQEGDWVLVRGGVVKSFRGELEIQIDEPGQAWPYEPGTPLAPLPTTVSAIGESLEGRLVTFTGFVTGWQGDSIFLGDPANPDAPSIRVTVRSSLDWRRPYVQKGELFAVTGVVSQFGTASPWNDGYRVLVRFERDLVKLSP